jgi:hypothetical protein
MCATHRRIEVHTTEPLVPCSSRLEVEITIAKLKKYKSPGSDQISAELLLAGCKILLFANYKLINSIGNEEKLPISGNYYCISSQKGWQN